MTASAEIRRRAATLVTSAALLGGLGSCGRPATVEECEEIVARIAELEIEQRGNLPKSEIPAEVEATKASLRETTMKDCAGKRITDDAMKCVRAATASADVIDCFD